MRLWAIEQEKKKKKKRDKIVRERDGNLTGGEHIPAFELHVRDERAEDGEGYLRRRSPRSDEGQVSTLALSPLIPKTRNFDLWYKKEKP